MKIKVEWENVMEFDFVIGNPSYQVETIRNNKGFAPPVYHKFLENAYKIGEVIDIITSFVPVQAQAEKQILYLAHQMHFH